MFKNLTAVFEWCIKLRKNYSHNNDIWDVRRHWEKIAPLFLKQMNDGTYAFKAMDVYIHDDAPTYLWSSLDMMALKLLSIALSSSIPIPPTCYHVKGGIKKAVKKTASHKSNYTYVFRSDVKSFYESITFDVLMDLIKRYVKNPILLTLTQKALERAENCGGNFTFYNTHSLPKGSPLSPLLGGIMLMPLDLAMAEIKDIFYARYMDDWVIFTKTKSQLRKVIKKTHQIMKDLKLSLHPTKTYIGKIASGFNFLGYYMDDKTILPSTETIRRMCEKASALGACPCAYRGARGTKVREQKKGQTKEITPQTRHI